METEKRLQLILRNTADVITTDELTQLLREKAKPSAYIGYAPTGKLHIGYYVPLMKLADLLKAGFNVTFLIADIHAHLDDLKSPWELLDARSKYYQAGLTAMLRTIGADIKKVKFVRGSEFQLYKKYIEDILRLAAMTTLARSKRAAAEVVRFGEEPKLGGFIYPLMQAEDVAALKADVAFGGIDQRGPYMLAREVLPELKYKKPICVLTPLIPGLVGAGKMSASVPESKIDILDDEAMVKKKIEGAFCPAKQVDDNGVLAFLKHVIMPIKQDAEKEFILERPEKYGGPVRYKNYETIEADFADGKIHPMDLKTALAKEMNGLLSGVRKDFSGKEAIVKKAYPGD